MERQTVDSSNIQGIGYDEESNTLEVTFKIGKTYTYNGVPVEVWREFAKSPSKGIFFFNYIRDRF